MLRKIVLWKEFEKAIIGNYPLTTKEYDKSTDQIDTIITEVNDLNEKKMYYYNALTEFCIFKNNRNRSVIEVYS